MTPARQLDDFLRCDPFERAESYAILARQSRAQAADAIDPRTKRRHQREAVEWELRVRSLSNGLIHLARITSGATRAARRDASWYRNPNTSGTHGAEKFHVVKSHGEAACGTPVIDSEGFPPSDVTEDALVIPWHSRCKRPGCWQNWPPLYRAPDGREFTNGY